ncbi:MAG: hypothetical protein ABIH72_03655 [archaeon]
MHSLKKRAQITIFVIIAILIVSVLIVLFWPRIESVVFGPTEPNAYMKGCVEDIAEDKLDILTKKGGSFSPENSIWYEGYDVDYLCYTNEYYDTCTMQQPLLKQHIEEELEAELQQVTRECALSLKKQMEKQGYIVALGNNELNVEFIPDRIIFDINMNMVLNKREGVSDTYETIKFSLDSGLYDLVMISTSILNYEARLGDSDPLTYMLYYPDLKVEKYKQSDGSKIYVLTDRITEEKFIFATRSLSWPPGYSTGTIK